MPDIPSPDDFPSRYPLSQWGTKPTQQYKPNLGPDHLFDDDTSRSTLHQSFSEISAEYYDNISFGLTRPSRYCATYAGSSCNVSGPNAAYMPSAMDIAAPSQLSSAIYQYGEAARTVAQIAMTHGTSQNVVMMPQGTYQPPTQIDRRRFVEGVTLESPVMFYFHRPQYIPGFHPTVRPQPSCGISLRDCLNNRLDFLKGREELMFVNRGPSIAVCLMWPGYGSWSRGAAKSLLETSEVPLGLSPARS